MDRKEIKKAILTYTRLEHQQRQGSELTENEQGKLTEAKDRLRGLNFFDGLAILREIRKTPGGHHSFLL